MSQIKKKEVERSDAKRPLLVKSPIFVALREGEGGNEDENENKNENENENEEKKVFLASPCSLFLQRCVRVIKRGEGGQGKVWGEWRVWGELKGMMGEGKRVE